MTEIAREIEEEYQERMKIYKEMEAEYLEEKKKKELDEELARAFKDLSDNPDDLEMKKLSLAEAEERPRKNPLKRRKEPLYNMRAMKDALP